MRIKTLIICLLMGSLLFAKEKESTSLNKLAIESTKYFDVNRIKLSVQNNGTFGRDAITGNGDFHFDDYRVIYVSGLWMAAKVQGSVRASASDFVSDFVGSAINEKGMPYGKENESFRMYKISRGDNASNNKDYANWPIGLGAPTDDRGNPLVLGDQTLWCSFTDLYRERREYNITPPLGAEVHRTIWGWENIDNVMFVRWEIINRSDHTWEDAYFGIFSDPDIINATNDLTGSDSTLQLVYCYDSSEWQFLNPNHAVGYVLLESPSVPSPGDTAITYHGKKANYKNVPVYAPKMNKSTVDGFQDVPYVAEETAQIIYNRLKCLDRDGNPAIDPTTGKPSHWAYSGDPVKNVGWVEEPSQGRDRRMMLSMGPLDMTPGEKRSITAAVIVLRRHKNMTCIFDIKKQARALHSLFQEKAGLLTNLTFAAVGESNVPFPLEMINITDIQRISFTIKLLTNDIEFVNITTADRSENVDVAVQGDVTNEKIHVSMEASGSSIPPGKGPIAYLYFNVDKQTDRTFIDFQIQNISFLDGANNTHAIAPIKGTIKVVNFPDPPRLLSPTIDQHIDGMKIDFQWSKAIQQDSNEYVIEIFDQRSKKRRQCYENHIALPTREFISLYGQPETQYWTVSIHNYDLPIFSPDTFRFSLPSKDELTFARRWCGFEIPHSENIGITIGKYFVQEPYMYVFTELWDKIKNRHYEQLLTVHMNECDFDIINQQDIKFSRGLFQIVDGRAFICHLDTLKAYSVSADQHLTLETKIALSLLPAAQVIYKDYVILLGSLAENAWKLEVYRINGLNDISKISDYDISDWLPSPTYLPLEKVMLVKDNFLLLSFGDWGAFDLSNPDSLRLACRLDVPGEATAIAYENDNVYIGNNDNWVGVYDVSSMRNPGLLYDEKFGDYRYRTEIEKLSVKDGYIFVDIDHYGYPGFQVCHYEGDKGFLLDGIFAADLPLMTNQRLYSANRNGTIILYKDEIVSNINSVFTNIPQHFRLNKNYPNPFNRATQISFYLPESGEISLTIFNIRGQKVKTLLRGHLPAGRHQIRWDGTNEAGEAVASGLFMYQLKKGENIATQKMILLK